MKSNGSMFSFSVAGLGVNLPPGPAPVKVFAQRSLSAA
jgi:hypothetical protein